MFPHPTISPPGLVRKRSYPLEEDDSAVSSLWAASFQKLLGPLENLTEQWISACNQPSSPLRDETLAALSNSGGSSATRRLLLDALYSASLSMNQVAHPRASYTSWLPASPPESALEHGFSLPLTSQSSDVPQHYHPPLRGSSSHRNRSWSQPVDSSSRPRAYEQPAFGNRSRVTNLSTSPAFLPVLPTETTGWYDVSPSSQEHFHSPPVGMAPTTQMVNQYPKQPSPSYSSSISLPALPGTSSQVGGGGASPPEQARNTTECYVLHDRELQSRYPNDALEKSVQTLDLVEQSPGPVDHSGMPTTLLKFSALDPFPRTKVTYHLAVLGSDNTLTTLTPDGRQISPSLAIFRFLPGDFVVTPNSPIGSSPFWRMQECRGSHPSTGGTSWTARFDQNNMRRRARILGHFATCQLGDVAPSLRAFANSLKTAGEERREESASGSS